MLTPMQARTTRVTHTPHEVAVNILSHGNAGTHYMLWLARLTNRSEFHLYSCVYIVNVPPRRSQAIVDSCITRHNVRRASSTSGPDSASA